MGGEGTPVRQGSAQNRYYLLIADAVAGLEHNTVDARRAIYERARKAFITWLGNCDPPLAKPEVERQRLAFERVISQVEAQVNRQQRMSRRPARKERRGNDPPALPLRTKVANFTARLKKTRPPFVSRVPSPLPSPICDY